MAVLAAAAMAWAAHPAMMRASAATGEAQPLSYRPTGMGQFQHANKAYPDIDLRGDPM
jgi:hypothetical protein